MKEAPFQLIEDPKNKRKYLSSSTSSTIPSKKPQSVKPKNHQAKVLSKVYDNGDGREIYECDDKTIKYFPASEYDSMVNPPVQGESLHSSSAGSPETVNSDVPSSLSLLPG